MKHQTLHRLVLDNGIILLLTENPTADLISARLFFKDSGSRWESPEKAGLSNLLATVLTKGSKQYSSAQIAEKIESIGASLSADTGSDYFAISLKTVSTDFAEVLELAKEIIRFPTFPPLEIELEKNLISQSIRSQMEQPFNVAFNQLRASMYGDHPYSFSILGTEKTIHNLSRSDLEIYHQSFFRPDRLVISLSGRITLEDGRRLVEKVFGDWEIPNQGFPVFADGAIAINPCQKVTIQETQQSIIMLGYLAPSVKHEDYAPLKLLSTYLGNGLSSRLFVELREKRGLAYDVSAFYPTRLDTSQFVMYIGTAPDNTGTALEGLRQEAERLCQVQLSTDELQAAKNKILGQYALGKQTNAEIAQLYGWYETLGLGVEFDAQFQEAVTHVTSEQAQSVAREYLGVPYISLVGPGEVMQDFQK